jgi:ribosome maturation protein Sdo1
MGGREKRRRTWENKRKRRIVTQISRTCFHPWPETLRYTLDAELLKALPLLLGQL